MDCGRTNHQPDIMAYRVTKKDESLRSYAFFSGSQAIQNHIICLDDIMYHHNVLTSKPAKCSCMMLPNPFLYESLILSKSEDEGRTPVAKSTEG